MTAINVAIFISGYGSNALNIIEYFDKKKSINIALLLSNNSQSFAIEKGQEKGIETVVFNNDSFKNNDLLLHYLLSKQIDFIVLAGFLKLIPKNITHHFAEKMVNIHPSLLPKYGGKGMYGKQVHLAVLENKETESGITIHYVNEEYDDGHIIFQKKVSVEHGDDVVTLTKKIQQLEHKYYPKIIEQVITSIVSKEFK